MIWTPVLLSRVISSLELCLKKSRVSHTALSDGYHECKRVDDDSLFFVFTL
jgi:hypothetical protein